MPERELRETSNLDAIRCDRQVDACDGLLRALTEKSPLPYDTIEALLLARQIAESRLEACWEWMSAHGGTS